MRAQPLVVIPFVLFVAGASAAQPRSADDLFREGSQLFARGETKAACERFAKSYTMDAAPGTLFNLAACHEKEGHLWQARGEFLDFVDRATKAGKADKAKPAADRAAAIEQHLPKVALVFPPQSNVAAISFDGVALAHEQWEKPIPVDAGAHTIEFQAPGTVGATRSVTTGTDAAVAKVDVPVLEPVPATAPASTSASAPAASEPAPSASSPTGGKSTRTLGFVVAGAGIVVIGVSAYFGVHTLSQKSDADSACGGAKEMCPTPGQTQAAQKDLDGARTSALISTVGLGVGIAAAAVGGYLIFAGGSHSEPAAAAKLRVVPTMGPGGGGLSLSGTF